MSPRVILRIGAWFPRLEVKASGTEAEAGRTGPVMGECTRERGPTPDGRASVPNGIEVHG